MPSSAQSLARREDMWWRCTESGRLTFSKSTRRLRWQLILRDSKFLHLKARTASDFFFFWHQSSLQLLDAFGVSCPDTIWPRQPWKHERCVNSNFRGARKCHAAGCSVGFQRAWAYALTVRSATLMFWLFVAVGFRLVKKCQSMSEPFKIQNHYIPCALALALEGTKEYWHRLWIQSRSLSGHTPRYVTVHSHISWTYLVIIWGLICCELNSTGWDTVTDVTPCSEVSPPRICISDQYCSWQEQGIGHFDAKLSAESCEAWWHVMTLHRKWSPDFLQVHT